MNITGNKIKQLREEAKMTLKQLSDATGVGQSTISDIETGKAKNPKTTTLKKIADYFNVSVDYLLSTEEKLNMAMDSLNKINAMAREVLESKEKCVSKYDSTDKELDDTNEFNTAEEAMQFILKQPSVMGFGGFNADKLTEEEIIEFANELLNQLKILSYKYKR